MEKYYWLNKESREFLSRGYLGEDETAEQRIRVIAETAEKFLKIDGFANKFEDYMSRGWYSLASPVWSNFGKPRNLPISCYGSFISDSMDSILGTLAEVGMMSKYGGGTSSYIGELRSRGANISLGGKSTGPIHFQKLNDKMPLVNYTSLLDNMDLEEALEMLDCTADVISQSSVRRGHHAPYINIDHPDIYEFLEVREEGNPIQNLSIGVCISDDWMKSMIEGDKAKRKLWGRIIKKRFETGYPYIFFSDTVNNNKPVAYKKYGKTIWASNMCTEICNATDETESFVCCLASMNLLHYDDWKDTDAVQILAMFLDAVMEEFIEKTETIPFMEKARKFAMNQRALGLGVLGWHSYLQSKSIAFESMEAKYLNNAIFKYIDEQTLNSSKYLAEKLGEPELLKGLGERNITRMALAPTTSSSFILGQVSQSIEPLNSNYFVKELAKGRFTYKNPYLKAVLKEHGKDTKETWDTMLLHGGSVHHLDFLSEHEKNVFKTFGEISQKEIAIQASQRQKYIDQSQSLNFTIHHDTPPKQVSELMIWCWENGIKTLYYQRGTSPSQEMGRAKLLECESCSA